MYASSQGMYFLQGVLINPGWEVVKARGLEAAASLAKLPIPKLCPIGFIFIWVQKGHISAVMQQMGKWGFAYVENLTWVFLHQNHSVLRLPAEYVQSSHLTLFLFRKEGRDHDWVVPVFISPLILRLLFSKHPGIAEASCHVDTPSRLVRSLGHTKEDEMSMFASLSAPCTKSRTVGIIVTVAILGKCARETANGICILPGHFFEEPTPGPVHV